MEAATIRVDNSLIESIIRAEVVAAIGKALGSRDEMIQSVVAGALAIKVDAEGRPDRYGYNGSKTYLEWFVTKSIHEAVGEARRACEAVEEKPMHREHRRRASNWS